MGESLETDPVSDLSADLIKTLWGGIKKEWLHGSPSPPF